MCLGIPMKITKIYGSKAAAEAEGLKREVDISFMKSAKKGDFVIIHAGFAIEKIDKQKAHETLALFREMKP